MGGYEFFEGSQVHQVSVAAGSSVSLEKSDEQDCDTDHKGHEKDKECDKNHERSRDHVKQDCGHPRHKSLHHKHASGCDHSVAVKHG